MPSIISHVISYSVTHSSRVFAETSLLRFDRHCNAIDAGWTCLGRRLLIGLGQTIRRRRGLAVWRRFARRVLWNRVRVLRQHDLPDTRRDPLLQAGPLLARE